eukprot:gene8002-5562_t
MLKFQTIEVLFTPAGWAGNKQKGKKAKNAKTDILVIMLRAL